MLSGKFYTVKEIADLLAVNEVTIRNIIKNGELRAIKLERGFRIAKIDLEAFLSRHATSNETSQN
jgi:excisionase family DNA binding protein